jgi:general secretion pathway protein G
MQSAPIVPQLATAQPAHVTVNVNGPKATSGLGIAALVLGILACLTCWIPLIGLLSIPFSVLGILFGIIGFVVSGVGRRSGIGMPVAGMVICVVTLVIAVAATDVVLRPTAWLLTAAQAKLNLAETQIATLGHQLELYNLNIGHYPTDDEGGLKALLVKPNFSDPTMGTNWSGPYINQDQLKDPWGHPMHYRVTQPGTPEALQVPFKLWSTGPDGEADTSSPDKVAATMLLPTKTKLAPTVPPQAPPREPCSLTYASYMRLQCGMTAQQVASILGNNYSGQEVSRSYMPGIPEVSGPVETVMFELQGDHGNATLIFQNAILVQKSQFGLQ